LDERAPLSRSLPQEEASARLVQLYFQSHCPATIQDFCWWSGLSQTEARKGLEAVKSEFVSEEINGQTYWISNAFRNLPDTENTCRLLPAWDEYLVSYKDREAILPPNVQRKAISSNGIFHPVIVVNGQVVGLWKKSANKKQTVLLDFFEQPDAVTKKLVEKAIE
jgi:hypothetical protein